MSGVFARLGFNFQNVSDHQAKQQRIRTGVRIHDQRYPLELFLKYFCMIAFLVFVDYQGLPSANYDCENSDVAYDI